MRTSGLEAQAHAGRLLAYQRAALLRPARMTWNNWSRQAGKSHALTLRRLLRGVVRQRMQLFLSAGARQVREVMVKLGEHAEALVVACARRGVEAGTRPVVRRMESTILGTRFVALPANPLTARGYTADIFLDEFAMHRDSEAIWSALLPTLLREQGEADVASTPRGRNNMFYRLRDNPQFAHQTVTLPDAIAAGLAVDLKGMRAALGDERLFRQEFLCEFDGGQDAFLDFKTIAACSVANLAKAMDYRRLSDARAELYAGVDVGRMHDLTVIWLWERDGEEFWTRGVLELAQVPFNEQWRAIQSVLKHRSVRRLCIDATGMGHQIAERTLAEYGDYRVERIVFRPAIQASLAGRVRMLAEQGRLRIPADDLIQRDWHSLRRIVTSSGHVRLRAEHSEIGHADRFWAAALGLQAAMDAAQRTVEFETSGRLAFGREGVLW